MLKLNDFYRRSRAQRGLHHRGAHRGPVMGALFVAILIVVVASWFGASVPAASAAPLPGGAVGDESVAPRPIAFFGVVVRTTPGSEAQPGRSVIVEGRRIVSVMDAALVRLSSSVQLIQGPPDRTLLARYDVETYVDRLAAGSDAAAALIAAQEVVHQSLSALPVEGFGTVTADAPAELILLACDPLDNPTCGSQVVGVYTDGAWRPMEDGAAP